MIPWKERLYAFLLSHVLGPWLDDASLQLLHQSIEVSLRQGKLVLKNIGLNTNHLTTQLRHNKNNIKWRITVATLERLDITLQLQDVHNDDDNEKNGAAGEATAEPQMASSGLTLAWQAMNQLGSASSSSAAAASSPSSSFSGPKIALVAKLVLDGIVLHMEPEDNDSNDDDDDYVVSSHNEQAETSTTPSVVEDHSTFTATAKSLLHSYMEAALASLRLSVQINQIVIRVVSPPPQKTIRIQEPSTWMELRIKSISYQDVGTNTTNQTNPAAAHPKNTTPFSSSYNTVIHKALDFSRVSIAVGRGGDSRTTATTVLLLDGVTQVRLRVIEYKTSTHKKAATTTPRQVQQDIEVFLGQKLNLFVDTASIQQVHDMLSKFNQRKSASSASSSRDSKRLATSSSKYDNASSAFHSTSAKVEDEDLKSIQGIIMEQYNQARARAERHELRGGLLIPDAAQDGNVTFDAFFDANDQSFSRYSTLLTQSIIAPATAAQGTKNDFVHTKLRCHLHSASAKISFSTIGSSAGIHRPAEYILATVGEIQASSSLSLYSSNHALSISHFEIEEARLVQDASVPIVAIGNMLTFLENGSNSGNNTPNTIDHTPNSRAMQDENVLLHAPCISVNITTSSPPPDQFYTEMTRPTNKKVDVVRRNTKKADVEVHIEPFVLTCPGPVISNLLLFSSHAFPSNADSPSVVDHPEEEKKKMKGQHKVDPELRLQLRASCAHLDIVFPLEDETIDLTSLFSRAPIVPANDYMGEKQSALGIRIERLFVETQGPGSTDSNAAAMEVGFQHFLAYAYLQSTTDSNHRLLDIIALGGGESDESVLRISHAIDEESLGTNENPAVRAFPLAPAVSSFKARQDDDEDEEDNGNSHVVFTPSEEFEVVSRNELRGPDPQPQMLKALSRSIKLIEVDLSHLSMDLSMEELSILLQVVPLLVPPHIPSPQQKMATPIPTTPEISTTTNIPSPQLKNNNIVSIKVSLNDVAIALHDQAANKHPISHDTASPGYSYLMEFGQFCSNLLLDDGQIQHARILTHDTVFHEVAGLVQTNTTKHYRSLTVEERIEAVRRRLWIASKTNLTPILYRSHLFPPISRQSPGILIDIVDSTASGGFDQKNLHLTLYDLTYRFDYDSKWMQRFQDLVQRLLHEITQSKESHEEVRKESNPKQDYTLDGSMTRLFLCLADCNLDYSSPTRWETASRTILRLGEVRVSCNLIHPSPLLQAIKFSIGDMSVCLCNSRFPYTFEDSKFIRLEEVNDMEDVPLSNDRSPDEVVRAMNFRTIVTMDCLDAIVTLANSQSKTSTEPQLHVGLSIGEINLFACKDSFAVFVSSIGEFCAEACAMDDQSFQKLKAESDEKYDDSTSHDHEEPKPFDSLPQIQVLEELVRKSTLYPSIGTANPDNVDKTFLLDGYDWTTIDQDENSATTIPRGDEQAARWYGADSAERESPESPAGSARVLWTGSSDSADSPKQAPFKMIDHHFPLQTTSDTLGDGDMGAAKYAGTDVSCPPKVKSRVTLTDLSLKLRLFDGYDWPESLSKELREEPRRGSFLIDIDANDFRKKKEKPDPLGNEIPIAKSRSGCNGKEPDRKASLMADLLDAPKDQPKMFENIPLPEERGARLKVQSELRRLARRSDKYFQFSVSGVQLRSDSMEESDNHRLVSCLNLKAQDFFFAETISGKKPIKLAGEWYNDEEHPRDNRDGLFMIKMITWHAEVRVNKNGELVGDECEAAAKILPLRCFIDQKAIRFISSFFRSDSIEEEPTDGSKKKLIEGLHPIPQPRFRKFIAKPLKLKVNYTPEKLDREALRNGQIVELLNLTMLESLVLTTEHVEVEDVIGFGGAATVLVSKWISHVSSTQLLKFLRNTKTLEPISTVGEGLSDAFLLPWEALRDGGNVHKAFRAGLHSFGRAVTYETLNLTSQAAGAIASVAGSERLPQRPHEVPTGVGDTGIHVVESLAHGLLAAKHTIIVIPYREYHRNGTTGLVTSVIRGIPVAITAPASGAAEALSYALIGVRNQLHPDIRKEEEVSQRGLRFNG